MRSAAGCPPGLGQGPRGFPRGQPPPVEREPAQHIKDEQRDPGTRSRRGTHGQRVNDHGDLAGRRRDRLTRVIQPDRYPGARCGTGDTGRGDGGQHAGLLAAPITAPRGADGPIMIPNELWRMLGVECVVN
jgi:hypothetical protein